MTIWHCGNYGAEMQTYATVKALRKLRHDVEVLDYSNLIILYVLLLEGS